MLEAYLRDMADTDRALSRQLAQTRNTDGLPLFLFLLTAREVPTCAEPTPTSEPDHYWSPLRRLADPCARMRQIPGWPASRPPNLLLF